MKSVAFLLTILSLVHLGLAPSALAYYPQHPDVLAMIDRGVKFMESRSDQQILENRWGGQEYHIVMMGYAHFKARHDASAPLVQRGIKKALSLAAFARSVRGSVQDPQLETKDKSCYAVSICTILLCEVDAKKYKSEIEVLRDALMAMQKPHGGFGYPSEENGIISQVQYVVLAFWALKQNGFTVKSSAINQVNQWLLRVQDVGGAWPYRATDPGPSSGLIAQGKQYMSHSTALAGGSSVLISGDYFGLWREGAKAENAGVLPGMPMAVRLPGKRKAVQVDASGSAVKPDAILAAVDRMNQYRQEVPYDKSGSTWHYYAMYSLERFESFYELALDKEDLEPQWYNDGVERLKSNQSDSGGWGVQDLTQTSPPIATSFAILFLVRSTQQSIASASSGTLAGGQGLPKDTTDIKVSGTKITGRSVAAAVGEMLDLLEDDGGELEGKSIPDDLQLAEDPKERRAQLDRLERLVRGSQSWQARRVAARLLGKSEEMRVIPALIFALSDPDKSVRRFARDGLRFISRKFDGYGLADDPTDAEVKEVQEQWRQWYLRVNPKHVFLD